METRDKELFDTNITAWLLNIANDMRRFKGDKELDDLPQSIPQDTHHCIIANAFNYGCYVDPGDGIIDFQSSEDVDTYFKVMGLNKDDYNYSDPESDYEFYYNENQAPMTKELISIAEAFDDGYLFEDYAFGAE